jgi:ABC-2 type transport system ATP-binding protein
MGLKVLGISKTYPNGVKALQDISLSIPNGMFGLLGPNGAGKSSLMRTIATLQTPDTGSIEFDGMDVIQHPDQLRSQLGYLPQEFDVYPKTSAEDLLHYLAELKGIGNKKARKEMVNQLLEVTNLQAVRGKAVATYSGGMKQRFGIAQALIGMPKLIIVDEPTAGLDPEERSRFHNLLADISSDVTVILSTHIVSDVSDLCQNFAIINGGQVLTQMRPQDSISKLRGHIWELRVPKKSASLLHSNLISQHLSMGECVVRLLSDKQPQMEAMAVEPTLEDFYFATIKGLSV